MEIIKKFVILFSVLILVYFLSGQFGNLYIYFFPQPVGHDSLFSAPISESAESELLGIPLVYVFCLSFLFTAFGGKQKYWWVGILLIPAVAVELYLDVRHIYFPIALGIAGWLLGWVVARFLPRLSN